MMAKMADLRRHAGCGNGAAVGAVLVACDDRTASIHDRRHIALEIGDVVIDRVIMLNGIRLPAGGVEEVEGRITIGFSQEFTTDVHISVLNPIHSLACAQNRDSASIRKSKISGWKLQSLSTEDEGPMIIM